MLETLSPMTRRNPDEPETGSPWRWRALLAAPFAVCLAVLLATGWTFHTFWDGDEVSHWALIRWFARGLPRFKADYPYSATTPLFHLLNAVGVRLLGPDLPLMRAGNTLLSVGGLWALWGMLRRVMGHGSAGAALLTAVFGGSCYYFGYSFRLLTDNLAIVACLLAMTALFRAADPSESRSRACFILGCLWVGLAVLTRQSYVFLCLPFGVVLLRSARPVGEKLVGAGTLGLALVPFALLVLAWRGLVPPAFQVHHTPSPVNLYPLALPLMVLGSYAPFFFGPGGWRRLRAGNPGRARELLGPVLGGLAALAVLARFPLFPVPGRAELTPYFPTLAQTDFSKYFAGSFYALADRTPRLALCHNSLLFWLLLPAGAAAAVALLPAAWRRDAGSRERVNALFLGSVLLSSTLNSVSSQKYYDGLVLLFLLWDVRGAVARDPWRRGLLVALIAGFAAYAAVQPVLTRTRNFQPAPLAPPPPPP